MLTPVHKEGKKMFILAVLIGVVIGVLTMNALAGFGAFIAVILFAIWFPDHVDDLLV